MTFGHRAYLGLRWEGMDSLSFQSMGVCFMRFGCEMELRLDRFCFGLQRNVLDDSFSIGEMHGADVGDKLLDIIGAIGRFFSNEVCSE